MTPCDVAEEVLAAIAAHDDPGVWIGGACADRLRAQARALSEQGPAGRTLWGIPFAVKDNIDVAGLPTTAACPAFAYVPDRSAPVVEALEAAGAMLVGKTNLDQFATGLVGVRSPYGAPRNVLAPGHVPGGSSSGSAVAVAAGLVAFALGTDTAGSGRVPAMMNGVVGLKPTRGLVSTRGVVPACRSLDCVSVFAAFIDDAMAVLDVTAGFDPLDAYSRAAPPRALARIGLGARPRLGVPRADALRFFGRAASEAAFHRAVSACAAFAELEEIDLAPFEEAGRLLYDGPWVAERLAVIERLMAAQPEAIHPVVRGIIARGRDISAVETFRSQYRLAELKRAADGALASLDALVLPTAPFVPTLEEVAAEPVVVNSQLGTYTTFVNLLDLAAVSVPAGLDAEGLPFGVSFIGPAFTEARLAAIARRFAGERVAEAEAEATPSLELAVFGAHMRGLPLNGELRRLGASFVREVTTAPLYRLVALPGAPPRPGLIRSKGGAAIAGELWRVPQAAVASLLAAIPAPLALGRVTLADGSEPVGFLCADAAPSRAEDITGLGGWRAYLAAQAAGAR
ncbi:allophanate hydrolase [Elioraea tepida]|uniref:Allophanate hydrolase n=2 Tax=Elioraea tepida TaxID=2843330 RepID=A0A975U4L2_9PROT|nr:allophanate hydrolase [Elioraea tepida]